MEDTVVCEILWMFKTLGMSVNSHIWLGVVFPDERGLKSEFIACFERMMSFYGNAIYGV